MQRLMSIIAAAVGLSLAMHGSAQRAEAQETLTITPRWAKGDKLEFELIKSREQTGGPRPSPKGQSRTGLTAEILQADDDGFVVAVTFGEVKLEGPSGQTVVNNPLVEQMTNLVKGMRLEYGVNQQGELEDLLNFDEVKRYIKKTLDFVFTLPGLARLPKDKAQQIRALMEQTFSTKEQVVALYAKEPQLLFVPFNRKLLLGETVETRTLLPNALGGDPIPGLERWKLESHDANKAIAHISAEVVVDSERARDVLLKTLKAIAAKAGAPFRGDEKDLDQLSVNEKVDLKVDVKTGWIIDVRQVRGIRVGKMTRTDRVALRRKDIGE
jgi:hypothetical protein